MYGIPVELIEAEEGGAYGAGLLAGVGTGVWKTVEAACEAAVHVRTRVSPISKNVAVMERRYAEYGKIYPALRGVGHY